MPRNITDSEGRTHSEGSPDFDKVRIDNLEDTTRELAMAVAEVQKRLAKLDDGEVHWPGDRY